MQETYVVAPARGYSSFNGSGQARKEENIPLKLRYYQMLLAAKE